MKIWDGSSWVAKQEPCSECGVELGDRKVVRGRCMNCYQRAYRESHQQRVRQQRLNHRDNYNAWRRDRYAQRKREGGTVGTFEQVDPKVGIYAIAARMDVEPIDLLTAIMDLRSQHENGDYLGKEHLGPEIRFCEEVAA